jgi:hypothetical protein
MKRVFKKFYEETSCELSKKFRNIGRKSIRKTYGIISRNFDDTITKASLFGELGKNTDTKVELTELLIKVCENMIAYEHYEKRHHQAWEK